MSWLRKVFTNFWVISILIAVIVAAILVLLLPLLIHALDKWYWRLALLGLVILVWAVFAAVHVFSARNASDRIADAMAKEGAAEDEGAIVGKRLSDALAQLKKQGGKRDYLYSRPWYLIIGPPGAGKTTALESSGLRFPFADAVVKGVGGTRNLDFMFADEAVLVDTAGRYTSQDSQADRDRQGWLRFLDALRKYRPLQPINGVMVAIGIDTLLAADVNEIDRHGDLIRRRLAELREGLEINVPVYVVFTKTDLLAGFSEFFDDLDVEQRRAVLGTTFDAERSAPDPGSLAQAFDEIAQAIADRSPKRLQDELDGRRRGLIVGFPPQFAGLRNAVARLLAGAFPRDAREGVARLRGFYFTSGIQQGTPLDKLLGGFASVYDAPAQVSGRGRSYFLNRLLMEVIFGEAGLAEGTAGAKARRGAMLTGGLVTISVVFALVLAAWIASFIANLKFQSDVKNQANRIYAALQAQPSLDLKSYSENDAKLEEFLPVLDALRAMTRGYDERRKGGPPFPMGLGLYQKDLSDQVEATYLATLKRAMLPRLLARMEQYQETHQDAVNLYGAVKAYLSLGKQGPNHKVDAKYIQSWVLRDWATESMSNAESDANRERLKPHLAALFRERRLDEIWEANRVPLNQDVINASQNRLRLASQSERIYGAMKSAVTSADDWKPNIPEAGLLAFANGPQIREIKVPYFFTRRGFYEAYMPGRKNIPALMAEDRWVVGDAHTNPDARAILSDVAHLYAADYSAQWKRVIVSPQPANVFTNDDAANAFIGTLNPYGDFLRQVVGQVNFGGKPSAQELATAAGLRIFIQPAFSKALSDPTTVDAGKEITGNFRDLIAYVTQGQLEDGIKKVRSLIETQRQLRAVQAPGTPPPPIPSLEDTTLGAPAGVGDFFKSLKTSGQTATTSASLSAVRLSYVAPGGPKEQCDRATAGYPFVRTGGDSNISEAVSAFADGGPFSSLRSNLNSYIDQGGAWHWNPTAPADLNSETPERLRQAKALGAILRPSGLQLQVRLAEAGPSVTNATLIIGDSRHDFLPGTPDIAPMRWTTSGNGVAKVVFTGQTMAYNGEGDWALFRLFQLAKIDPAGAGKVRARFGSGAAYVIFEIQYPTDVPNPFSTDPWAFRCPVVL